MASGMVNSFLHMEQVELEVVVAAVVVDGVGAAFSSGDSRLTNLTALFLMLRTFCTDGVDLLTGTFFDTGVLPLLAD